MHRVKPIAYTGIHNRRMDLINIATTVATPLAAICFFAALAFLFLRNRSSNELKKFEMLGEGARATIADDYLSRYGMKLDDVSSSEKVSLARDEMQNRHRFQMRLMILMFIAFVILLAASLGGFVLQSKVDTSGLVESLDARAVLVLRAIDDAIENRRHVEGKQKEQAGNDVAFLQNSKRTFEQLHKEYLAAIRAVDIVKTHQLLPRITDLLGDARLMNTLNVTMRPVYETNLPERANGVVGEPVVVTRYVGEIGNRGDAAKNAYLQSLRPSAPSLRQLALP